MNLVQLLTNQVGGRTIFATRFTGDKPFLVREVLEAVEDSVEVAVQVEAAVMGVAPPSLYECRCSHHGVCGRGVPPQVSPPLTLPRRLRRSEILGAQQAPRRRLRRCGCNPPLLRLLLPPPVIGPGHPPSLGRCLPPRRALHSLLHHGRRHLGWPRGAPRATGVTS
ncbi:hypothetical protein Taro_002529 [Colocasia esculenta]|uniref:Uncharacterized protein n=1 Tax=Colocasia esculenta TaxID=4460 RepID=A0A843TCZ2_COLES|nr:hypothetical protein [Colocasia esculenta]